MKNILNIKSIALLVVLLVGCNEDEWLKEIPLDIYSPENMYVTPQQFDAAVASIYAAIPNVTYVTNPSTVIVFGGLADNLYHFYSPAITRSNFDTEIIPESTWVKYWWTNYYKIIFNANVVLDRIDLENVNFPTESQRSVLKAEAYFFRAFAYKNLAILFGGVPLVIREVSESKRDFTRASRQAVLDQVINDLEYAVVNLPDVSEITEDGRLTKAAANHLLTEVYLMVEDWDNAISAASAIIDNPAYALMTERFGAWSDRPGDVFRDLFIRNNQNRGSAGGPNTEAIWVGQFEYNTPGGGDSPQGTRFFGVQYWALSGKDGRNLFFNHSSQNGGRGFGFMANNDYLNNTIWEDDWNDMRNSEYNIRRDMVANNPASAYFGQKIVENDAIGNPGPYNEFWRPYWAKLVPFDNFPAETIQNPATGQTNNSATSSFTDSYIMRLSETYLLRAEAYVGKGNPGLAAADINVVRARANALAVSPEDVDLDYILDERARELTYEELRLFTLMRVNKLAERVVIYNPYYNGKYAQFTFLDRYNLWPIPQSEIERNTEAVLEQNPGYN